MNNTKFYIQLQIVDLSDNEMTNFRTVKKNGKKQAVPIGNGSTKTYGRTRDINKERITSYGGIPKDVVDDLKARGYHVYFPPFQDIVYLTNSHISSYAIGTMEKYGYKMSLCDITSNDEINALFEEA